MSNTAGLERMDGYYFIICNFFSCKPSIFSKPAVLLRYFLLDSANAAINLYEITLLVRVSVDGCCRQEAVLTVNGV